MATEGVQLQDVSCRKAIRRSPESKGVFSAVSFESRLAATLLNFVQKSADVDRDPKDCPGKFSSGQATETRYFLLPSSLNFSPMRLIA